MSFTSHLSTAHTEIVLRAPHGGTLAPVETVWFTAGDGFTLNFKHLSRAPGTPDLGPVMLVHGSGVRANLFCSPSIITLPAMLAAAGFDVWMLNWRASIDLEPSQYTFDDAAVHDFPAAVAEITRRTGHDKVKAVVHCQGSHAFMMSITAGLLPDVTRVVANSTALHPRVRRAAMVKLPLALWTFGNLTDYFNPQYGLYAPRVLPKVMDWMVRAFHHECRNAVCKHSSFVYGFGFPTMWDHDNLDDATHDWIKGEFAHVPVSLFRQTRDCLVAGHLVTARNYPQLPHRLGVDAPKTDAVFTLITGTQNRTFHPSGMQRSFAYLDRHTPDKHRFHTFSGYGHLDIFLGQYAAHDVFPHILGWLRD
ncbi:alpha/beta hydrolase [Mycobacterium sp. SMC-4]|uniref:alpha/beta hydrolase n=1 Tax=Mycobacterium sp. SMC-4 TaxID=2857059 RepID=UPI0021B281F3|nr:alpha/beta hydrolase [Mycobacterium sp. SMC-4]UXA18256.1 alpha/beta hydrolase [Mycobacterium sp. SMC-4]